MGRRARTAFVRDDRGAIRSGHYCDVAVNVGPQHPGPVVREAAQYVRARASVRVLRADAHERHPRIDGVK